MPTLVTGYLDLFADATLRRLDGLDYGQQTQSVVPSGWEALGMVKHLAATTRFWIRHVLEDAEVDFS